MADLRVSFPKPCDEIWEAMAPSGCDRVCTRCEHVVHDLREYTLDEVEALLRTNPGSCVRAQIGNDGQVTLKPGRAGKARRMVIAAATTAGLLAAATQAYAREARPGGVISGNYDACFIQTRAVATGADGVAFRATVRSDGRFKIKHLPPGTYTLTFVSRDRERWRVENVVVREGETSLGNVQTESQCVVVGLLRIENDRG